MQQSLNDNMNLVFGIDGMKPSDQDYKSNDANIIYFGFVNKKGEWYILKQTTSTITISSTDYQNIAYRYCKGDSDYTTNYAARQTQDYDYFNAIFK